MTGYYRDDDKFEMRELTDEQLDELKFLKRLSGRYAFVGMASIPLSIWLVIKSRWWHALFVWILGNFATMVASYFRQKAKEVGR